MAPQPAVLAAALAAAALAPCAAWNVSQCGLGKAAHVDLDGYDRFTSPTRSNCGTTPTEVEVQFRLNQVNRVDEERGFITVGGFFRTWWKDSRLANASRVGPVDYAEVDEAYEQIWSPNLYFDNLVTQESDGAKSLVRIYPDGSVYVSRQLLLTVKCKMKYGKLPFDKHLCQVVVVSYSENRSSVRLTAKGGAFTAGRSGIGIDAMPFKSGFWDIAGGKTNGFQTPGLVVMADDGWDYVHFELALARKPYSVLRKTLLPDFIFLGVAYMGFFIDVKAVPARAFMAVFPLLMLVTLTDSVYKGIPQSAENIWVADYLWFSFLLVLYAVIEFGVSQWLSVRELANAGNLQKLKRIQGSAQSLINLAKDKDISLLELLKEYATVDVEEDGEDGAGAGGAPAAGGSAEAGAEAGGKAGGVFALGEDEAGAGAEAGGEAAAGAGAEAEAGAEVQAAGGPRRPSKKVQMAEDPEGGRSRTGETPAPIDGGASQQTGIIHSASSIIIRMTGAGIQSMPSRRMCQAAKTEKVTEASLLVIMFCRDLFESHDRDESNFLSPAEIRKVLHKFGAYLSEVHTSAVMCMCLRDKGHATPLNEREVAMTFSQFMELLISLQQYLSKPVVSHHSPRALLQSMPPSKRCDFLSRRLFLAAVILKFIIFIAIYSVYE